MIAASRDTGLPAMPARMRDSSLDEQDLLDRMRGGDRNAFDQFFETYAPRVAAFAARRSALDPAALEDVVQNTMIHAMRGLRSFRGGSSLFTWLCQICRNQLADLRRKTRRQPGTVSFEQLVSTRSTDERVSLSDNRDPLDECAADSTRSAVRQLVNQLPASYSRILELRFGDDLTVPQIARVLQISESAAESRLVRARQAFLDLLRVSVGTDAVM